jgi:anaerobic nitric oxide reductase transcription regulator
MTSNVSAHAGLDRDRLAPLLAAVRGMVSCDAAALLRLERDRRAAAGGGGRAERGGPGPRLPGGGPPPAGPAAGQRWAGLRFAADCGLPDPYDGLVDGQPDILPVHDCMGAPLQAAGCGAC